mgnify:CR=1 FL=1
MSTSYIEWAEKNLSAETIEQLKSTHDADEFEAVLEQIAPLRVVYPEEFQRYYDILIKYMPKSPCHVKCHYDQGFLCIKGKRKTGERYDLPCYPDLVAKMLDYERWKNLHPNGKHYEGCWIALREPKKTRLSAIDFDNKSNLLGYYRCGQKSPLRPLVTMPLSHLKAIKRIYDAFPNRVWCISSATLGLHIWEIHAQLQDLLTLQIDTKTALHKIRLGSTEVHPMHGRAFRRPFGEDYYTIIDNRMLSNWIEQLNFFQTPYTPSFASIFKALRSLLDKQLGEYLRYSGHFEVRGVGFKDFVRLEEDLKQLDQWAKQGFPDDDPVEIDEVKSEETPSASVRREGSGSCDIDLTKVCNGQWIQYCEVWARHGLPCPDSIFIVCSQLAKWLYYIEFFHLPEQQRLQRIAQLLTTYCKNKNNNFISRWNAGLQRVVQQHIERSISSAVQHADNLSLFQRIREGREKGQYKRLITLEHLMLEEPEDSQYPSSSCCAYICCHSTTTKPALINEQESESSDKETRKQRAEAWQFKPDYTPIPVIESAIEEFYSKHGLRLYRSTLNKMLALINYLASRDGEARLGVESLKKIGFNGHQARQHIQRLEQIGVLDIFDDYCPAAGRSKRFRLTNRAMTIVAETRRT